ncbi:MAG: hypothetical protein WCC10_06600 [Tumebacillaceae bacterium]
MRALTVLLLTLVLLSGCMRSAAEEHPEKTAVTSTRTSHNPTPEEVLAQQPNADIFKFDGITFQKAEHREDLQTYKPGKRLSKIEAHYTPGKQPFLNGTATLLPIGTEIYDTDVPSGPVLIVKQGDRIIYYVGLVEG